jgi:hypothetical protein
LRVLTRKKKFFFTESHHMSLCGHHVLIVLSRSRVVYPKRS